jgi:hypothetical protein
MSKLTCFFGFRVTRPLCILLPALELPIGSQAVGCELLLPPDDFLMRSMLSNFTQSQVSNLHKLCFGSILLGSKGVPCFPGSHGDWEVLFDIVHKRRLVQGCWDAAHPRLLLRQQRSFACSRLCHDPDPSVKKNMLLLFLGYWTLLSSAPMFCIGIAKQFR